MAEAFAVGGNWKGATPRHLLLGFQKMASGGRACTGTVQNRDRIRVSTYSAVGDYGRPGRGCKEHMTFQRGRFAAGAASCSDKRGLRVVQASGLRRAVRLVQSF